MPDILMPKATAVWLVDNTGLTFDQVAAFCGLHPLEVKGIADGDVLPGVRGADPIANGQLTREEIARAEADPGHVLQAKQNVTDDVVKKQKAKRTRRYTPLSKRQERPNAIAWILKNHPEVSVGQIGKLLGTTKTTIEAVRDRTHWNASNIQPQDPVALGLCSQIELDEVVRKAAAKRKAMLEASGQVDEGETLQPLEAPDPSSPERFGADGDGFSHDDEADRRSDVEPDAASVFADLGGAGHASVDEDDDEPEDPRL